MKFFSLTYCHVQNNRTDKVATHNIHENTVVSPCDSSVLVTPCEMGYSNANTFAFEPSISHEVDCVETCSFYSRDFDNVSGVYSELLRIYI